jgi:hypothetical protein
MNVTVPLTTPLVAGVTVAVKVTDCPAVEGLSEETRAVLVVV